MAKDRDERYSSTLNLARDLKRIRDHLSETGSSVSAAHTPRSKRPKWLIQAALVFSGVVLGGMLVSWLRPDPNVSSPTIRPLKFSGNDFGPGISPDGRTVAFISGRDGGFRIWLKQLESGSETVLTPGPDDDFAAVFARRHLGQIHSRRFAEAR